MLLARQLVIKLLWLGIRNRKYKLYIQPGLLLVSKLVPPSVGDNSMTIYEKTRHMVFFVKIKFDVYLISSTLELTYLQV